MYTLVALLYLAMSLPLVWSLRRLERRFKLPVARVDERYTSVEAEHRLRGLKRKKVDSVAAQLILEQYLDQAA